MQTCTDPSILIRQRRLARHMAPRSSEYEQIHSRLRTSGNEMRNGDNPHVDQKQEIKFVWPHSGIFEDWPNQKLQR